jgi:hypothetical protein
LGGAAVAKGVAVALGRLVSSGNCVDSIGIVAPGVTVDTGTTVDPAYAVVAGLPVITADAVRAGGIVDLTKSVACAGAVVGRIGIGVTGVGNGDDDGIRRCDWVAKSSSVGCGENLLDGENVPVRRNVLVELKPSDKANSSDCTKSSLSDPTSDSVTSVDPENLVDAVSL